MHHDDALGRLTDGGGRLDAMTAAELKRVAFKATGDRMITLGELCDLVAGRATLVIELKSRFDGDRRLVGRAPPCSSGYRGPAAVMSFDPAPDRGRARDRAAAAARHGGGKPSDLGRGAAGVPAARRHDLRAGALSAPAIHRLLGARPAGAAARGRAQHLAACRCSTWTVRSADDRHTRRALCRPDDLRRISAVNLHYVRMIAEPMIELTLRVANSIGEVAAEAWDACANPAWLATAAMGRAPPARRLPTPKKPH